jgi:hypothetical protein
MGCSVPSCTEVGSETPLRLTVAAALAFPDGTLTASGLRREAARDPLIFGLGESRRQHEAGRT